MAVETVICVLFLIYKCLCKRLFHAERSHVLSSNQGLSNPFLKNCKIFLYTIPQDKLQLTKWISWFLFIVVNKTCKNFSKRVVYKAIWSLSFTTYEKLFKCLMTGVIKWKRHNTTDCLCGFELKGTYICINLMMIYCLNVLHFMV